MNRFIRYAFIGIGGTLLLLRIIFTIQHILGGEPDWYMPTPVELYGWFFLLCFTIALLAIFIIIRVITRLKKILKKREQKRDEKRQRENENPNERGSGYSQE